MARRRLIQYTVATVFAICVFVLASKLWKNETVIAKINGKPLLLSDIKMQISHLPQIHREIILKNKKGFVEKMIGDELLFQEAMRLKIHKRKKVRETFRAAQKKILIAQLLEDTIESKIHVSDEEIKLYYDNHLQRFTTPCMVRASHILVADKQAAVDIHAKIENGASFELLARDYSADPTKNRGGDIGFFSYGQLDPDFEAACKKLRLYELSPVVKTKFGFHIIKLTGIKEAERKPLNEVKGNIRRIIISQKRKSLFSKFIDSLKCSSRIKIYEKNINDI